MQGLGLGLRCCYITHTHTHGANESRYTMVTRILTFYYSPLAFSLPLLLPMLPFSRSLVSSSTSASLMSDIKIRAVV